MSPTRFPALVCAVALACAQESSLIGGGLVVTGPHQSSPIVVSPDDQTVVQANPDLDTITIFDVSSGAPAFVGEVKVGDEPVSVAFHPMEPLVFVALAGAQTVVPVDLVKRKAGKPLKVGVEPMALVFSPSGNSLYVANSGSNTVQKIDTTTDPPSLVGEPLDLSPFGTAPRALAMTNNGDADDTDETLFVAMFFGQLRPGKTAAEEGQDDQREGHVVALSSALVVLLGAPNPVVLGPMADTGFTSSGKLAPATGTTPAQPSTNTVATGAFPNQLASIAIHPNNGLAYVVSTGASPNGPVRFNVNAQGLVSVFDAATRTEVTSGQTASMVRQEAPLNLNRGVNFDTVNLPRLFMTNPVAMAWRPNGADAWVVIQNSDLVTRLTVDASGVPTVGNPIMAAGTNQVVRVDLQNAPGAISGKAPRGIAINNAGTRLFVTNFVSRSVTALDITNGNAPAIAGSATATTKLPKGKDALALLGAEMFYSGRGPTEIPGSFPLSSESWGGCVVCHPNGRSDGITWMFDGGPRQTIPLDSKGKLKDQRILNWSAVRDENQDFELNSRGVFGGRGLIDDDRLFLAIGGTSGASPNDTGSTAVEEFNAATNTTSDKNTLFGTGPLPQLDSLGSDRRDFGIATLDDDRVYIIGGRSNPGQGTLITASDTVLEFNPRTNTLRTRKNKGFTPRHSLGAAAVKTDKGIRIYAVGGYESTDPTAMPSKLVQEYDPGKDKWRTVAPLPSGVAQFGITVTGGINTLDPIQGIHVVSGNAGTESSPSVVNPILIQRFNPNVTQIGLWTSFNPMGLTARRNHGAATLVRGAVHRVFVIGGRDSAGNVLDTVEEYNSSSVSMQATTHTSLPRPLANFGISSAFATNQIFVIGGQDNNGADRNEVLACNITQQGTTPVAGNPSGVWSQVSALANARRQLGVSTPPGVTNFLPVKNTGRNDLQDAMAFWVKTKVRPAKGVEDPKSDPVKNGRIHFGTEGLVLDGQSCATCHGGKRWTRSTVNPEPPPSPELAQGDEVVIGVELRGTKLQPFDSDPAQNKPGVLINVGTFTATGRQNEIRVNGVDPTQTIAPLGGNGFNIPSLLSVNETAPYFYSGLAQTLEQVLDGSVDNNGGKRVHFVTDMDKRTELIKFLRSIDAKTPTFP